jgi:hypothetical protein
MPIRHFLNGKTFGRESCKPTKNAPETIHSMFDAVDREDLATRLVAECLRRYRGHPDYRSGLRLAPFLWRRCLT